MKNIFNSTKTCFLIFLVAISLYLCLIAYFTQEGFIFNGNNTSISLIITIIFIFGAISSFYLLYQLSQQEKAVNDLEAELQKRKEAKPHDITIIFNTLPISWIKDEIHRIRIAHENGTINMIGSSRILENEIRHSGNFVKYLAGVVMLIGLLGTFIGIIGAVQGIQDILPKQSPDSQILSTDTIDQLYENMTKVLNGLDKAFGTSITGITASMLLSFLYVLFKHVERELIKKVRGLSLRKFFHVIKVLNMIE